jgi:hypothetical protein
VWKKKIENQWNWTKREREESAVDHLFHLASFQTTSLFFSHIFIFCWNTKTFLFLKKKRKLWVNTKLHLSSDIRQFFSDVKHIPCFFLISRYLSKFWFTFVIREKFFGTEIFIEGIFLPKFSLPVSSHPRKKNNPARKGKLVRK